jgi:hypothetical protein
MNAFPSGLIDPSTPMDAVQPIHEGMTLRDYFAAKAMQSLLIDPRRDNAFSDTAKYAYLMADQMLEARK